MSSRWVYDEEDDDSENRFVKFKEKRADSKPIECSRLEDDSKFNKPKRKLKHVDEEYND